MVFRCAEFFFKGAKGTTTPIETQELLMKNTHALGMFFDSIILNEKIPVFNYADTFDKALDFDQRTLTRINEYDDVLYDINVADESYKEVKSAALNELSKLYEGPNKVAESLVKDIVKELSAAGYGWTPSIGY